MLFGLRHSMILAAFAGKDIVATLSLPTKKPWAIDRTYFTPVERSLYLTNMAVMPVLQRQGIGRMLIAEGERQARGCITSGEMNDIHDTYPWRFIGTLYIYILIN